MDFSFTEEQKAIQELSEKILEEKVTQESLEALDKKGLWFHEEAWKTLAESELLSISLPEAYGGSGYGFIELCLFLEQIGRRVAPIPAYATLVLGAWPIMKFGSEAQKKTYLEGIKSGETILTGALMEPNNPDPFIPTTQATEKKGRWHLSGVKTAVSWCDQARCMVVTATTPKGGALFLVEPNASGMTKEAQTGTTGEPLSQIIFENTPAELLGKVGEDLAAYIRHATLGLCALEVGIAREAISITAKYITEREQFGKSLSSFQAVRQRIGDAYIDLQCMVDSMLYAACLIENSSDAKQEITIAKYWSAEGGHRILAAAQHLHGSTGFDRDYPLYRYFLWSRHNEMVLGSSQVQLAYLGDLIAEEEKRRNTPT